MTQFLGNLLFAQCESRIKGAELLESGSEHPPRELCFVWGSLPERLASPRFSRELSSLANFSNSAARN